MNQNIESAIDHGTSNVSASVDALADTVTKLADRLDDLLEIADGQLLALRAALEWLEDLHKKGDEIKRELSYLDGSIGSYGCRIDELNLPTS